MIAGLQKQRIAAVGDSEAVAAIDTAIVRAGATATCRARSDGGVLDHVTIGIGVGVGGDDHHHHDHHDGHHDDRPRD